jgi:uncharacterized protein GlcG (DUF336 family)
MNITLDMALEIIAAARDEANNLGVPMVISVVDQGGNLVASQRMDDALLVSVDVSLNKAYTAVAVKVSTQDLAVAAAPGAELFGLHVADNSRIVIFGGGIPLVADGKVVGGVGISGGNVEQDVTCAKAAVEKFKQLL